MQAITEFSVRGSARYLSHIEMMRVFERALARAEIPVVFSEGFNPHPRMSIVLPRSVGVETEGDLFCLRVAEGGLAEPEALRRGLASQMPGGIEIGRVEMSADNRVPEPVSAEYVFMILQERFDGRVEEKIGELISTEHIEIERQDGGRGKARRVDVRPYVASVGREGQRLVVGCLISTGGTIRVGEIMQLLGLEQGDLTEPVRRRNVKWRGFPKEEPKNV